jgi:hypothetical protein
MVYGITFNSGNSSGISLAWYDFFDNTNRHYESCIFNMTSGASAGAQFQFGNHLTDYFKNCTFSFSNAGHSFNTGSAEFDGCTFSGTTPTDMIRGGNGHMIFRGCDLSAFGTVNLINTTGGSGLGLYQFRDCKMPTTTTLAALLSAGGPIWGDPCHDIDILLLRCSSAGTEYQYLSANTDGTVEAKADVARTGGAKDGGTAISWKCATSTVAFQNAGDLRPPLIAAWNDTVATNVTATAYGIINAAAVPTNMDQHIDVDYMGTSGNTVGSRKTSRIADVLASPGNYSADTSDWTAGSVPARTNSHTYAVGDVIKLASNTGRVFFCTASSGNTAGSEPGGYASAVDGGSVTDGSATFRAGCRFSMAVTLTSPQPQIAGLIYCQIKFGKASATVYIDPLLVLT